MLLPKTAKILKDSITIISARQDFEGAELPSQWKIKTFLELFEIFKFDKEMVTNLVVVGDSMNEMNAG